MDLSGYSISELIELYSLTIKELKKRNVLRTSNVVGEIGEYRVLDWYHSHDDLPDLSSMQVGMKNFNALSKEGDRYSIKSTTGSVTGVFYGLQPPNSLQKDKQLFEYVVICKMDSDYTLEAIYEIDWDTFLKHKHWHSRMQAWNLIVSNALKNDSKVLYEKKDDLNQKLEIPGRKEKQDVPKDIMPLFIQWNKSEKINHKRIHAQMVDKIELKLGIHLEALSDSRRVSSNKEYACFVLSSSYSAKNSEYWYSIDDEYIPWLELFPNCYVAFGLGSADNMLLFEYSVITKMLEGCLKTKHDPSKHKKAHYHISFGVDDKKVYFKQKKPKRQYIDVTSYLI